MSRTGPVPGRRTPWRTGLVAMAVLAVSCGVPCDVLAEQGPRTPATRGRGGDSPFRLRGFAGTSFEAAAFEQPGCPVVLSVTRLSRNERGVTVSLELNNLAEDAVSSTTVGVWIIVPDGTVRGYQRYVFERPIAPADHRAADVIIRTTTVFPDDTIIVAVQEATGDGAAWRKPVKELETEIRRAITQ